MTNQILTKKILNQLKLEKKIIAVDQLKLDVHNFAYFCKNLCNSFIGRFRVILD